MIKLICPKKEHEQELIAIVNEFTQDQSDIHGSGGLQLDRFDEWLIKIDDYHHHKNIKEGHAGASTYLAVNEENTIVGFVNIRHYLTRELIESGSGHVGYSVRPSERRKGYASEMLKQAIDILQKDYHQQSIMVGCYEENIASKKTILRNGGVYTKTVIEEGKPTLVFMIS